MLLLTVREWLGSPRDAKINVEPTETLRGFVTRQSLSDAIRKLRSYEDAYKRKYTGTMSVEFAVVAVATIEDLNEKAIDEARMELIETMGDQLE
jgi:hypothetical protein